jgi:hypothetical protein
MLIESVISDEPRKSALTQGGVDARAGFADHFSGQEEAGSCFRFVFRGGLSVQFHRYYSFFDISLYHCPGI